MSFGTPINWPHYFQLLVGLIILVDLIGIIPIFVRLTADLSRTQRNGTILISVVVFGVTMTAFAIFGDRILSMFGISMPAFQIAGGLFLLLIGFEMITGYSFTPKEEASTTTHGLSIGIVPLGVPLLAGPAAITMVVLHGLREPGFTHELLMIGVILSVAVITLITLYAASQLFRVETHVGKISLIVLNRMMGLIVMAIAVQFIITGLSDHFGGL